ncbi:MAG: Nif3-like dinuclear metal center hexameric protein [Oscillospiraceae bacterium]|nr:Nif3-like dinuclear metal center hexameric protein [Oscillospiraceae bacterium]
MTTVADILNFIEAFAPPYMKESWDNVGLLCGSKSTSVTKVLVALDPFEGVCEEAAAWGAELIVTHHPLIFQAPKSITDETSVGRAIMKLCVNGISAINAHTNLDCTPGGVNDALASRLGLQNIEAIAPAGTNEDGIPYGLLRCGTVAEQALNDFLSEVQCDLGCKGLRYVDGGKPVRKVAVGGGSCAGAMLDALYAGCDTFVTADVKYNQFWDARDLGLNLIDAGHFATENPVVAVLAEKIAAAFPEIEVKISETHADCMKFY